MPCAVISRGLLTSSLVGVTVFWLALDGASFDLPARTSLGIAVCWTILLGAAAGLLPWARLPRAALLAGGLLVALSIWTLVSAAWGPSTERAVLEADRTIAYLGIFALVVTATAPGHAARWLDGLAWGIAAIGLLALAATLFRDAFPTSDVVQVLGTRPTRPSYPLNYTNGIAIFAGLAFPLLIRIAATGGIVVRGIAAALIPALAGAIYLTSSRGGIAVAVIASGLLVASAASWQVVAASTVAAGGSAAVVAILARHPEFVNDPLAPGVDADSPETALLIGVVCVLTGATLLLLARLLERVSPLPWRAGWIVSGVAVLVLAAALVAADPVERFAAFREPPPAVPPTAVNADLVSVGGTGRWQYWTAAVDEFRDRPLLGGGAGSYEAWWSQHGTIAVFTTEAHSLYLEVLAELGPVGFLLVAGVIALGLGVGFLRTVRLRGDERIAAAAALACFGGYAAAAGVEWMWELTVVSVVGFVCLGLLLGPATLASTLARPQRPPSLPWRAALGSAALVAIALQAVPLLMAFAIRESEAAARRGHGVVALERARDARALAPWAYSPRLQLALLHERLGDFRRARVEIRGAIERDSTNWRLWLVAARLATRAGDIRDARTSLERATALNPRSPLFS